jgi:hypothetical protein
MNTVTATIIEEIARAAKNGERVAACTFTACYPRANVSAAFRIARRRKIIAVDYVSCAGTPVYKQGIGVS